MTPTLEILERALPLIREKETLHTRLEEVNASLRKLETGENVPLKSSTKRSLVSRKPKQRRGSMQDSVVGALQSVGTKGMKVSEIAEETGIPLASLRVWIYTTGKRIVKKVSPGVFALKH